MTEDFYTSKDSRQPRMPVTSRIQSNVVCPHCQASGNTAGPNFVLTIREQRRCGRCFRDLPEDPDLPVHDSVARMLSALFTYGFQVNEFLEETSVACGAMVPQRIIKLHRQKDAISASVRWFEIERPASIIGLDWRSLLPHPGRVWTMGLGNSLLEQGLPAVLWSICQQVGYGSHGGFKVTERQLKPRHRSDDKLFFRLEYRNCNAIIPGTPHENVILVVRTEFNWNWNPDE